MPKSILVPGLFSAFLAWAIAAQYAPLFHLLPYIFVFGALFGLCGSLLFQTLGSRGQDGVTQPPFPAASFLRLSHPASFGPEQRALGERQSYQGATIENLSPQVSQQLNLILALVVRDYVQVWLQRVTSGVSFSNEIDRSLRFAIQTFLYSLSKRDVVQLLITKALPIINDHLASFTEAEVLLLGQRDSRGRRSLNAGRFSDVEIAARFKSGKLHSAASLASSKSLLPQQRHVRDLVERFMPSVLPVTAIKSLAVRAIIREIITCAVICPLLQLLSDPDFLFQQIDMHGRQVLREPSAHLVAQSQTPSLDLHPVDLVTDKVNRQQGLCIQPGDTEARYHEFLRLIRVCNSATEAQRMRNDITKQIQDDATLFASDGTHLRRLETAKRVIEQRVLQLSNQLGDLPSSQKDHTSILPEPSIDANDISLRDTLYDVAGLSYFMDFMDRFELTVYVQFWITVDGVLASMNSPTGKESSKASKPTQQECNEADRKMIERIYEKFLVQPAIEKILLHPQAIFKFVKAGSVATISQYDAACQALSRAQIRVFQEMEVHYFPAFKTSDLYYQWTGSDAKTPLTDEASLVGETNQPIAKQNSRTIAFTTKTRSHAAVSEVKEAALRRTAASSGDLLRDTKRSALLRATRRSLDENARRTPLFDDDEGDEGQEADTESDIDALSQSTSSLDQDEGRSPLDGSPSHSESVVESKIGNDHKSLESTGLLMSSSTAGLRAAPKRDSIETERPSLDSLGLLGTPSKRTVFLTDDLFGERETLWEDEDSNVDVSDHGEEVREADAGDLGLPEAVQTLTADTEKLEAQQSVLRGLVSKAELTNNGAELKILRKSVSNLERDLRRKQLQRQQFIVQERDNGLYKKASISVASGRIETETDGKEYAVYEVRIQRRGSSETPSTSWAVTKRYSQFHELHRRLRHRFPFVRELPFPKRQVVATLQNDFIRKRRAALEHYLQLLVDDLRICQSLELRAFLSEQPIRFPRGQQRSLESSKRDLISRIYTSLSEDLEDFVGNTPVLDQLSVAGQNLISAATATNIYSFSGNTRPRQIGNTTQPSSAPTLAPDAQSYITIGPPAGPDAQAEISALDTADQTTSTDSTVDLTSKRQPATTFIGPIADCFTKLFNLQRGNNWLRGRAVVIVLQQILGGTVERRVRDTFNSMTSPAAIEGYVRNLRETLWPDGQRRQVPTARSGAEKVDTRRNAEFVVTTALVEHAGSILGRGQAREAAKRVVRCFGNERLNLHLLFVLMDELVPAVLD